MTDRKQALWDRFCDEHRISERGVPLFDCHQEGRVDSGPFGKDGRTIPSRSPPMEDLFRR